MNDPIERQAAIDALIQKLYEKPEEYWDNGLNRYDIEATINALQPAEPPYNPDEWCHDCKEYDQERHCCPRWNRVIRKTVDELRAE